MQKQNIAPGARIVVRDAEWMVRKVDMTSTNGLAISVTGISELVKNTETIFLDEIDEIHLLDPVDTNIVIDTSGSFQKHCIF